MRADCIVVRFAINYYDSSHMCFFVQKKDDTVLNDHIANPFISPSRVVTFGGLIQAVHFYIIINGSYYSSSFSLEVLAHN